MATITICGLGPGGVGRITDETASLLAGHERVLLRTARHPGIEHLVADIETGRVGSFDHLYEQGASFDEVYRAITDEVLAQARSTGHVVYAVPGSPLVLERSVRHLRAAGAAEGTEAAPVDIELLPAVSFLDEVWARLAVDPVDDGVRLVDGLRFAVDAADQRGPLLVAHTHARWVLSDIKLALDVGPEQKVIVLQRLGTDDERVFEVAWPDLDREIEADHLTSLYLPELAAPVGYELARSVEMMRRLRADCPWDQEQTHRSLRPYLIEEAYEVLDAIDAVGAAGEADTVDSGGEADTVDSAGEADTVERLDAAYIDLEEELGDLWFQILFHCRLASEAGQFTVADVARGLTDKMIRRHPHVYGQDGTDPGHGEPIDGTTVAGWEALKKQEKGRGSVLDGIPRSLPALSLAGKVLKKADGAAMPADLGALGTEAARLLDESATAGGEADRIGAALLALVEVSRTRGVDPELALRAAIDRAGQRFRIAEAQGTIDQQWVRG
jgi:tetrapyrrole methylase family protein/MazG family protein